MNNGNKTAQSTRFAPFEGLRGRGVLILGSGNVVQNLSALAVSDASDERDGLTFMNEASNLGSVSMRSFVLHAAEG